MPKRFISVTLFGLVLVVALLLVSCGTDTESADSADSAGSEASPVDENAIVTIGDRAELRAYTRPSSLLSVDDFVSAGWKKNKEFPVDTLPEAESAWFGFFNRKDIELRFYPSHESAMTAGQESAESAIETEKLSGRGAGFSAVTLYGAYAVVGNTVMLCELSITDCTDLIEQIEN